MAKALPFEEEVLDLQQKLEELENLAKTKGLDLSSEMAHLHEKIESRLQEIYTGLSPWQEVELARYEGRPGTSDYLNLLFTNFMELHGDRNFRDDQAIVCGFARLHGRRIFLVANRKGKDVRDRVNCNFGMPHPEGYRKAMAKMKLAEKFDLPIVILINTPGAYPGIGAEERGQAQAIAENMYHMSALKVPVVCVIIGEGFSGGALGIGVGDRLLITEHGVFTVISPEGCAAILWKDGAQKSKAAEALRLTSHDLMELGIMDEVIPEPLGGAHRDPQKMAENLGRCIEKHLDELDKMPIDQLIEARYEKYRKMGSVLDPNA